ncbi:unnamed protein product [Cylicocyclus nassatus]|uniref:Uncharacterized protein n=1 Tax=Cylicocyclus nassatus TaxID=53992 RepID=A0AA36DPJ2_CYLNA|nr:unnamed protein product [Cylicocyclus nassatus]
MFLSIATLFATALCVTGLERGRPVCSIDFEEDESMADFRKFANAPAKIEAFLGKTLADDDRTRRYEVYHSNPSWVAMLVNVVEKKAGERHFIRLSRKGHRWIPITIKEKGFEKWKTVCTL